MGETHVIASTNKKVKYYIPDDIIVFILSKLPLKSLRRFECVCKSWALLFRSTYFMNMYINNLMSSGNYYDDTYLVLHHSELPTYKNHCEFYFLSGDRFENKVKIDWPAPFQKDDTNIYVLGSVSINGIICLKQGYGNQLVLWNPTTGEFNVTPPSPFELVPPHRIPCYDLHGFGYDHIANDYKVIQFVDSVTKVEDDEYVDEDNVDEDRSSYETFWEIYSLRSNSWRKLDVNIPNLYYYTLTRGIGVYLKGMCHWWARTDGSIFDFKECLVSFDFSNELLFTTPMPAYLDLSNELLFTTPTPIFTYVERRLVLLNESIALISTHLETAAFHISILGELGVRESWTKLFIIGRLPFIEHPIGVGNKSNIVFFKKTDHTLAWVDLNTKMIEELGLKVKRSGCHVGKYKKSFLPIGGMNN